MNKLFSAVVPRLNCKTLAIESPFVAIIIAHRNKKFKYIKRTFNLPDYSGGKIITESSANVYARTGNVTAEQMTDLTLFYTDGSQWTGWRLLGSNGGVLIDAGASSASKGSHKKISLYSDLSLIGKQITAVIKY